MTSRHGGSQSQFLTAAKWTLEQYHQMIAAGILDGCPVELLNGEIIEMSPEGEPHAYSVSTVSDYLKTLLVNRAQVREGHPITLPTTQSEPEPDIAVVQPLKQAYRNHHPYPENIFWLIEFANTSLKKDLDPKANAYAAAGIPEYWIVNLQSMELIVLRYPSQGAYQSQATLTSGTITSLAFPDVAIAVSQLLN
ncbi:Uma2 family endonuclease [Synechococcales cyanobacterium C]|uniref:Uma2 family endonuclease n=1 Tax=Petrachloros mirabilis ULC683 TaxID=2781853 RepID=A0A8K1ZZ79_9CYAN|nr:Uma2 family endonuclease [Petrachloros mirabilis]NCJ07533.1 Uma2 family endonuclease [Petrachloros mirabilis ULC683]